MSEGTRMILVRHAQTEWNSAARFQGILDSPLTKAGIAQSRALGARLVREKLSAIYSSDLGRAMHTARIVAEQTGHTIVPDPRLRERALGIFQGLDRESVNSRYPVEAQRYFSRDPHFVIPGGESAYEHFRKGYAALHEFAERHLHETFLVVTHGGLVSSMFRHVLGIDLSAERRYALPNAAFNCFPFEDGGWMVSAWGDVGHFPTDLEQEAGPEFVDTSPEITSQKE